MREKNAPEVYELFDKFIDNCLLKDISILTDKDEAFTLAVLAEVKNRFMDQPIDGRGATYWDKIAEQFGNASYDVKLCFAHLNWFWSLAAYDITVATKRDTPKKILKIGKDSKSDAAILRKDYYPKVGVCSTGQYHKTNKPFELNFIILLSIDIKQRVAAKEITNKNQVKQFITEICLKYQYAEDWSEGGYRTAANNNSIAMHGILLHLCDPEFYEPIVSERDKDNIVTAFYHLVTSAQEMELRAVRENTGDDLNREEKIFLIRKNLTQLVKLQEFTFYQDKLRSIWNFEGTDKKFSPLQALIFKKAVILYGPPGTGKTYEAEQIAAAVIKQHYIRQPERLAHLLTNEADITTPRVHRFQFNPNTSYEEFIAGYQIVEKETRVRRGKFLEIVDIANAESDFVDIAKKEKMPHVVILDEINRVDLSRVFGEVLSRLEYRDIPINSAISEVTVSIPKNLYIIGTMNEIDFSVERLDFALRRRFAWYPALFDKAAQLSVLEKKSHELPIELDQDEMLAFVDRCVALNDYITIERAAELGEKYQIGHAFFGDVVAILKQQRELGYTSVGLNKKRTLNVLWEISLLPLLDSYFGNIDGELKAQYLKEASDIFKK